MDRESAKRILQITQDDVTEEVIKSQYRKLARIYHPDVSTLTNATEKFQRLYNAQDFLLKNRQENSNRTVYQTHDTYYYNKSMYEEAFSKVMKQKMREEKEKMNDEISRNYRLWKKWERIFIVPTIFKQSFFKIFLGLAIWLGILLLAFSREGTLGLLLRIGIMSGTGVFWILQTLACILIMKYKYTYDMKLRTRIFREDIGMW